MHTLARYFNAFQTPKILYFNSFRVQDITLGSGDTLKYQDSFGPYSPLHYTSMFHLRPKFQNPEPFCRQALTKYVVVYFPSSLRIFRLNFFRHQVLLGALKTKWKQYEVFQKVPGLNLAKLLKYFLKLYLSAKGVCWFIHSKFLAILKKKVFNVPPGPWSKFGKTPRHVSKNKLNV